MNYFKHSPLLSIVKGVCACAFLKCTHHSLPRLCIHQITGMKLSARSLGLYNSTSTATLLIGRKTAEKNQVFLAETNDRLPFYIIFSVLRVY